MSFDSLYLYPLIRQQTLKSPPHLALAHFKPRRNNTLIWINYQPSTPPTEGAVGDDEVLALGHQPQIGVGVFSTPIVRHQCDACIGQRDAGAGNFELVGEGEIMRGGVAEKLVADATEDAEDNFG